MRELLFICTGNYYRSRFAEGLFNHLCAERDIGWRAFSRGLAIHLVEGNLELSPFTQAEFRRHGIDAKHSAERRISLLAADLERATRIIALKRDEHHPMMLEQFPQWADKIEYWGVHDLDFALPEDALPQIAEQTRQLYASLAAGRN